MLPAVDAALDAAREEARTAQVPAALRDEVAAVVEGYRPGDFEAIGITASPCGGCRQWIYEFRFDEVSYRREDGTVETTTPGELLPDTWDLPG